MVDGDAVIPVTATDHGSLQEIEGVDLYPIINQLKVQVGTRRIPRAA
jgi:hypothetical protein